MNGTQTIPLEDYPRPRSYSQVLVGEIRYVNSCEEIYEAQILAGARGANLLRNRDQLYCGALSLPHASYWSEETDQVSAQRHQ